VITSRGGKEVYMMPGDCPLNLPRELLLGKIILKKQGIAKEP
jgi:hypothetical protein